MSDLSRRVGALSAAQRAALERALAARRRAGEGAIEPRPPGPAPLAASQQRLWFLNEFAPGESAYHRLAAMWVEGELDVDLLEEALRAVVARHEVIRTSITGKPGDDPVQQPLARWTLQVRRREASGGTREERRSDALAQATAMGYEPYDLAADLTLRAMVVRVDDGEYLLSFAEHHISFDGFSDEIMYREVSAHYNAVRAGAAVPQPAPLRVQFADFAAWQQARIASGALADHSRYWAEALAGVPTIVDLPLDRPRPERQAFTGRHLPIDFAHGAAVAALRRRLGGTDFMILVAAWAATLYRWSGASDLVLGTPMANRTLPELEPLIGFFSNTVPLRVRVDGRRTFTELVHDTTAVVLAAIDHQDLPFERIVEAVAPERDPRANPLAQVNVRVQSGPLPQPHLDGAHIELVHMDIGFARFDLAVEMQMAGERIVGYLEYNESLFGEATAIAVRERLDALIGAVVADPDQAIWDLPQPGGATSPRRRRRSPAS